MRRAALLLVAAFALGGCGDGDSDLPQETATTTELKITVQLAEDGRPIVLNLTCDPAGGDHPNPEAACAKLAEAGAPVFDPVPSDQVCTKIFGGPQTATITGSYQGQEVDAAFSRADGCEIDRWDALGTEVFDIPLQ